MTSYLITCASMKDVDELVRKFINNNLHMRDDMKISFGSKVIVIDDIALKFISARNYKIATRGFKGMEVSAQKFEDIFCEVSNAVTINEFKMKLGMISTPYNLLS